MYHYCTTIICLSPDQLHLTYARQISFNMDSTTIDLHSLVSHDGNMCSGQTMSSKHAFANSHYMQILPWQGIHPTHRALILQSVATCPP